MHDPYSVSRATYLSHLVWVWRVDWGTSGLGLGRSGCLGLVVGDGAGGGSWLGDGARGGGGSWLGDSAGGGSCLGLVVRHGAGGGSWLDLSRGDSAGGGGGSWLVLGGGDRARGGGWLVLGGGHGVGDRLPVGWKSDNFGLAVWVIVDLVTWSRNGKGDEVSQSQGSEGDLHVDIKY